ncbi:NAD(P)/FAD-dependent oxidoreductase [Roseomonas sp. 18066]|uniref:NAD(P)/FAD-dependent oxidoreductase n=1 Tax=Roseomonas sp. 18066 TaxID=2681412 RepID=UPI0013597281|nr:FAD-dependent oxidoreductase [Roseomonas sp. 18066]
MAATPHRIVIVGGGAGGVHLATRLGRRLGRQGRAEILLVDRDASHIWKPRLHEVAAGTLDSGQEQVSFVVQASRHHFRYWPGEMRGLDRTRKVIQLGALADRNGAEVLPARALSYDTLVIAVGSRANDFGIPGVREHCSFIDSRDQAEEFNAALRNQVLRCLSGPDAATLDIAIVGAGATGVELSAEINTALDFAAGYGVGDIRRRLRLTLIETAPRILGALPERVADAAQKELRKQGVTVLTGAQVVAVDAAAMHLKDGRSIPAPLKVWAAGIQAPAFLAELDGLESVRSRQLVVRPTLQTTRDDHVFALGDCSFLLPEGEKVPMAATAQVAQQQAEQLARGLEAMLDGKKLPEFRYKHGGALVALGHYNAFGSLGRLGLLGDGTFIQGRFAQWTYVSLYRRHQLGLYGFWRSLMFWLADLLRKGHAPRVKVD